MRKILLFVLLALGLSAFANAQKKVTPTIKKGDMLFNAATSIGLGGGLSYGVSADYVLLDNLTGGVDALTAGAYVDYNEGFAAGVKSDFHYQFINKLDTYAGLRLGYIFGTSKEVGNDLVKMNVETKGAFAYGLHVGGRYFFTPKFAAFSELGFRGAGFVRLGISYKF